MPTNAEQIATIKSQTLARMAEITAQPKPTYQIDGQLVAWGNYLTATPANHRLVQREVGGRIARRGAVARIHVMFDPSDDLTT